MIKIISISIICILTINFGSVAYSATGEAIALAPKNDIRSSTGQVLSGAGMTIAAISALGALMGQSSSTNVYAVGLISGVVMMVVGNAISGTLADRLF